MDMSASQMIFTKRLKNFSRNLNRNKKKKIRKIMNSKRRKEL